MRKLFIGATAVLILGIATVASSATKTVMVFDDRFSPSSVTVTKGDTVKWVPDGSESHTVTAKDGSFNSDPNEECQGSHYEGCLLDGDDSSPGLKKSFSHTFTKTGTFPYTCKVHGFAGTVVVKAPPPTPKPATAKPATAKTATPQTAQPVAAEQTPIIEPTPDATPKTTDEVADEPSPTFATSEPLAAEETGGSNTGLLVGGILGAVAVIGGIALAVTRLRRPV
jgi:plastocyanin